MPDMKHIPVRSFGRLKLRMEKGREAKPVVERSTGGKRLLQAPRRVWYKPLTWHHRPTRPSYQPLPKARKIFMTCLRQLLGNWKLFLGIAVLYGLLNIVLVRSLSGSNDLSTIKASLDNVLHGFGGKLASSATSFIYLLGTSGSGSSESSGVYQAIVLTVCSLAFVWALRQTSAKATVRVRDSFYLGMYPLVPFLLVFLLISVQLLPLAIGGGLYSLIISNGIAIVFWEKAVFFVAFLLLAFWSLRMLTGSLIALYIVTLPDMTPLRAIRSAKQLVYGRRLLIWRKLVFLPVTLLFAAAVIELPLILFATTVAPWMFFVLSMAALPIVHGYLYTLYREML